VRQSLANVFAIYLLNIACFFTRLVAAELKISNNSILAVTYKGKLRRKCTFRLHSYEQELNYLQHSVHIKMKLNETHFISLFKF